MDFKELKVMKMIYTALSKMDKGTQNRILKWVQEKLYLEQQELFVGTSYPNPPAPPVVTSTAADATNGVQS